MNHVDAGRGASHILIEYPDVDDSGLYTCEVTTSHRSFYHDIRFTVEGRPKIDRTLSKAVRHRTHWKVECVTSGYPAQNITWFAGDYSLSRFSITANGKSTLTLPLNLGYEYEQVTCEASNHRGSNKLAFDLSDSRVMPASYVAAASMSIGTTPSVLAVLFMMLLTFTSG